VPHLPRHISVNYKINILKKKKKKKKKKKNINKKKKILKKKKKNHRKVVYRCGKCGKNTQLILKLTLFIIFIDSIKCHIATLATPFYRDFLKNGFILPHCHACHTLLSRFLKKELPQSHACHTIIPVILKINHSSNI